ncbi:E3 SUMO-protein ligase RanBP2-like [Actinia tenebrosa]|uniref:Nuclear pore complex protein Nup153 n=1 Tax=Actinia tenebrosa TaxID=6105 RepID=A0A6P8IL71_ACTTE|nr:E3 SUMO-protein ligase RanBP2-like [Actinia tenebrosa]
MGWTKDEVDKYVAKVERNIDSTREKNLKGFAFARLYREARDNVKAKRHLEAYLSVNESDFRGHRMMGQLFEETGNLEKALLSYRRSLDLNNTQHDLVLKVVELYCQVPVDPGRARAWADRAARLYPGHTAVFKLRMHLLESVGKIDYEQMEDLISEEMTKRPRDAKLHIRLIKVYAATGRLVEAYSHCASVVRTKAFDGDQEWWMCAVDVFEKYMVKQDKMIHSDRDIGPGHVILDSHAHLMAALSQLLNLFMKTEKTRETINLFYRLDHCLTMAHERKVRSTARGSHSQKYEWDVVLTEMRGQLYLHCATLILKLAKENYLTWPRALKLASVCYTMCAQVQEPDITTPWVATAPKNKDALRWYHMACYRLSHAGHLLEAVIHKYGEEWLDNCISDWCTQQGQEEILNTVYGEHRDKSKSFLANDEEFFLLEINLPSVEQLVKYDEVCVGNNPRNLELITWIGLHWYHYERSIRPGVGVIVARIFDGLRMDVPNIEQTAADTLCLRDLEAFVYAVIRTSAAKFLEDQDLYIPDYQPQILPQQLCDCLTSPAQEEWWLAAYNLYAGAASVSSAGRVRATVQQGLEVIRALGVHGLHVRLLIYLAFNFGDKASYLKTAGVSPWYYEEHWKSLQARSLHYWKEALILLEKIERNENIPVRKDSLFPLLQNSLMKIDIKFNIQKARLILGEAALREGKIEEAMEMFEQVKTTQGMWNLAQIYKYLANVEAQAAASEDLGSDAQSGTPAQEYYNCLNKARELLLACLDKVPSEERRRQTLQDELNDIEDMLNEDPNRAQANPRKQLDFRQLDFQASRSSTTMSDVQESEDNFWLEQPQDASSKDLIAKLSEVTLNNGYLQEQMAVRDQHLQQLNNKVHSLETELRELKRHGFSGFMSPTNYPSPAPVPSIPAQHNLPLFTSPVSQGAASYDAMATTPTYSRQQTPQNGRPLESTPVAKPSVKSRLGPRIPVVTSPEPPKIDSKFFAGLSQKNSPEKKSDLEQSEEGESEQGSVRHDSTSFDDGIHFEPIIPLPKQIEKKTGEEGEVVLFSKRAKLYRYDKDLKSWKERGTGNLKILSAVGQTRFRILMRREHILKICANHLITTEMELKPLQAGSQNTLVWNTAADFADETPNVEQLAVRFKMAEETAEFKAVFENCKGKLSGVTTSPFRLNRIEKGKAGVTKEPGSWECGICSKSNLPNTFICAACGANNTDNSAAAPSATQTDGALVSGNTKSSLFTKFLPKAGSWECTQCLVVNEEKETECAACGQSKPCTKDSVVTETNTSNIFTQPAFHLPKTGFGSAEKAKDFDITPKGAPNVSFEPQNSAFNKPSTDFSSALPQGNEKQASIQEPDATQKFPFEFNPAPLKPDESEETSFKRGGFGQKPAPFSFSFKPSTSSSSPLSFSFGKTQAPSFTLAPFGVSTTPNPSSQVNTSSSPVGLSFGSPSNGTPKSEGAQNKDDSKEVKSLTFSTSPSNALPGFDIDNDNEEEKGSASGDAVVPNSACVSSEMSSASQQTAPASSSVLSTIPPQLFWQQQLEEKFRFGNLHKTEPLAGMAPAVVTPSSGKPDAMYPASFILSKLASKSASASVASQPVQGMGENAGNLPSLQQIKDKSLAHGLASKGPQPPDLLMSLLQSKPRETVTSSSNQLQGSSNFSTVTPDDSSKTSEDLDDYSDDVETESEESGSYHSSDEYDEEEDNSYSNEDDLNNTVVSQPSPTTHQLLPQGQNLMQMPPLMSITPGVSARKFLTARSPLKKGQPKNDDCFVIYEIRATMTDRDKASRLLLPLNFFYHARTEPCPGCLGCDNNVRLKMKQDVLKKPEKDNMATTTQLKPEDSAKPSSEKENHIFGTSLGAKPLSFASFSTTAGATFEKKDTTHLLFPMAGQQLFGSPVNDASDETDIYFKPLIPLPELIKVTTGEEDHTLLFSERARLYRFDASASMWKERGIGDIKLLLDNKTGRGRVVMRREQVHKLCANHWITEDMELRTNSTSDRSWVWQTLADFSEEMPSQEKLAVRFKSPEIAMKFKDEFDDLVALARKNPKENKKAGKMSEKASEVGKEVGVINEQASVTPTSTSTASVFETPNRGQSSEEVDGIDSLMNKFKPKAGAWECKACLIQNNPGITTCAACNTPKPGQTSEPALNIQTPQTFTLGTSQSSGFSTTKSATLQFGQQQQPSQPDGIAQSKALEKPVFTIGRGDAPEEELEEDTYRHSPSKTSPNKTPSKTTPTSLIPPTSGTSASPVTGFAFGSLSHTKFNFKLELSQDKEPLKNSLKSPQSPTSPESPGRHPEAEDDNIHFEPIIPLPKKITKKTGEENDEVLFCQRAKLYRFDKEGNQWKERGLGDIKILRSTSSGKCRVVMRRDIVLKLCTNHQITPEMTLKPNAGSEKSWVWNTLADFADEVPKQETLAVRFKTAEIALSFKDAFEKGKEGKSQPQVSEGEGEQVSPKEDDSTLTQKSEETPSKQSTEDKELHDKSSVAEKSKDDIEKTESKKEEPQSSGFLFGSSNISSLSFASIASNIDSSLGILGSTKNKEEFKPGVPLFSRSPAHRKESEGSEGEEHHEDGPHFEPLVPLPEKVEARTGEEEEELIFSHRAKLYRFDRDLKQWKERGVGDIKILLHKKNSRVRILMRRDHILKICANHYVTPDMTLNPNGTSTKSWVWNTLADFSDEEVKAEQLAVRFKHEETAREFKEKFDKCHEKLVQHKSEVDDKSKTTAVKITDDSQESIVHKEEKDKSFSEGSNVEEKRSDISPQETKDSLMDKFKTKPGSWECEVCLVPNDADSTSCAACSSPKPGADTSQAVSSTQSKPAPFSFGGPEATGFSFTQNNSSAPVSFGGVTFGLQATDTFGNESVPNEDTAAAKPATTNVFGFAADSTPTQDTKKDSLMDKFKTKPGSWECEVCLVPNNADSTSCAACSSPKPGADTSQAVSSTQSKPAPFSFGGPEATGFSFGQNNSSAPVPFGGITFRVPVTDTSSQKPQLVFDNESVPKEDTAAAKPATTNVFGFAANSSNSASKVPGFTFGFSGSDQTTTDKDSVSSAVMTEAVIQPKKEPKTEKADADSTDAAEKREQDTVDLALTSVVEPSEEEKRRARSLLLPEGFFLYERQPQAPSSVVKAKTTSPDRLLVESKITTGEEAKKSEEPKTVFGSSSGLSFSSFSDVSTDKGFQFGKQKSSKGFAGQGTQLFSSPRGTDDGTEDDQDIYFKPLVSLSEIEVVTGEENEEKLFGHRAKLYRFESSVSQWKERGVGDIKILKNKNNNKFRVVMRRDQIHKLCANHVITTDMNLVPNAGNDRSWVWYTLADLSEEEPTAEKLAVRFKSLDTAKEFKKVFEECQNILRQQKEECSVSEVDSTSSETDKEAVKEPMQTSSTSGRQGDSVSEVDSTTNATDIQATGELHQVSKTSNEKEDKTNEVGSSDDAKWECGSCHVSSNSSNKTCPECGAPREENNGEINKQEICNTEEKQETPEPDSTVSEDKDSSKPDQSGFLFGTQSISSLSFSDVGKVGIFDQAPSSSEAFSFKGLNDQKPVEEKAEDDDHDDEYHHDVSGDHIHFEPIIALPEKIKAVTGEENEEVVFKERAKLYRYDKELKQWKERGVGEIKILTGKGHSRIVMRRDHIHKLCANHLITINMTLAANNSDRSWIWQTLADISEEQPKEEMLAVRFKTAENAQEFKKKFEECRDTLDSPDVATVEADESSEESSEKEEPSLKENEEKGIRDHQENASESTQEVPSSSTSPLKEAMMPTDSTQLVAGSLSTATKEAFHSFKTVKKEVKQFSSTTTSGHRTEQSAIANSYQEQNVVQTDGTKIEESRQMASFALQEKKITSSGEENPFQSPPFSLGARGMMQPSIFNQELFSRTTQPSFFSHEIMSRQGAGLFGRQPVFPTPSLDSTNQMLGAQSFTDQPDSSQGPDTASMNQETGPQDVQQTETRSVEMTQNISSSVVTSSGSNVISCSPEITKMLQEIQDKDQNNIKD